MDRTESGSPWQELSNGGLESIATLLVRRKIDFCVRMPDRQTSCKRHKARNMLFSEALPALLPQFFGGHFWRTIGDSEYFGDDWINCTYIHTSNWNRSCCEEGPLCWDKPSRPLYVPTYPPPVSPKRIRDFQFFSSDEKRPQNGTMLERSKVACRRCLSGRHC